MAPISCASARAIADLPLAGSPDKTINFAIHPSAIDIHLFSSFDPVDKHDVVEMRGSGVALAPCVAGNRRLHGRKSW
jgi:hypothetical protein